MKTSSTLFFAAFLLMQTFSVKASGLMVNLGNNNFTASTAITFSPTSKPGFDKGLDKEIRNLPNNHMNYIYSLVQENHKLYVNYLPYPSAYTVIDLQVAVEETGTFLFSIEDKANDLTNLQYSLTDVATGKTCFLTTGGSTQILFTIADIHKKKNFVLHIFPSPKITTVPVSCLGNKNGAVHVSFNAEGDWEAKLRDVASMSPQIKTNVNKEARFENLASGIYYVEIWKNNIEIGEEIVSVSQPVALMSKFTISNDTIYTGEKLFIDNFSKGGNRWYWEFGDTVSSIAYAPSYVYTAPGNYTLTLTTSNISGCVDRSSKRISVAPPQKPLAID